MNDVLSFLERVHGDPTDDDLLGAFVSWADDRGLTLYPAQEEAVLEVFSGNNVILNTPTGSGKSLVALAAHVAAVARGGRSVYTAPIKALVSEKFFELCRELGSDNVGMVTGDAAVNPTAPVICCTAEILSNQALRLGRRTPFTQVVIDEFHFYADPQRGVAWQIPLLELPHAAFLVLSATLGPTQFFEQELKVRTGRPTVLVKGRERPVPLDFAYRSTLLHDSLQEALDLDRAPVYLVHFTQRAAAEAAQNLMSVNVVDKAGKERIKEAIGGFRFDSPVGKDLRRWIGHGIGIHHAGLLPKYRLLVEKLAQEGLLKVICGTDTLGVGVNVPIRTVLFTQLCKYDGSTTRVLSVREFQQIAGRAGRKGFDDRGFVWVQAPPHVVENRRLELAAVTDPAKRKKLVKRKPPDKGYAHWSEDTFTKLVDGEPEPLTSSFRVTHQMVMNLLDRPPTADDPGGCGSVRRLMLDNHEPRKRQRQHIRRAIGIYRSLLDAGVVERLDEPDEHGRTVRVTIDLQDEFKLNQPLSLFVLDALDMLDIASDTYALDVLSIVESVIENPSVILMAQLDKAKDELMSRMKSDGVLYEERMAELARVEYPKPLGEEIYTLFGTFRTTHPWVESDNVKPKAVAREMYERGMVFREYVNHYGLKRSEGLLLRTLTDAYKGLVQNVPEGYKTDAVLELTDWLGEVVRQTDSSLIDEWERLRNPDPDPDSGPAPLPERRDVTVSPAFRVMVRNETFRWVQHLARRDYEGLAGLAAGPGQRPWSADALAAAFAPYFDDHASVLTDAAARGPALHVVERAGDHWTVVQTIADPSEYHEWQLVGRVDIAASRDEGEAVMALVEIRRL